MKLLILLFSFSMTQNIDASACKEASDLPGYIALASVSKK